jgi:hypothetical protein
MSAELPPAEKAEIGIIRVFAAIYPRLVKATDFELARREFISAMVESAQEGFPPQSRRSLVDFRKWLCANICVGHKYSIVEETPTSLRFRFTGCPWASCFRDAGEAKIGRFFCDVDETMAKAFNPRFAFERTKVLMDGDACCNHHYSLQ